MALNGRSAADFFAGSARWLRIVHGDFGSRGHMPRAKRQKERRTLGESICATPGAEGVLVRRIGTVGATEGGNHIGIEFETDTDKLLVLLIPVGFFQKFMLGLMTAGGIAHKEQLARLGSERNVLDVAGFSSFHPTRFEVIRGRVVSGDDVVLIRLKKGGIPVIDVTASIPDAEQLAIAMLNTVAEGPKPVRPMN